MIRDLLQRLLVVIIHIVDRVLVLHARCDKGAVVEGDESQLLSEVGVVRNILGDDVARARKGVLDTFDSLFGID